ncbi:solute carrier family 2, facilitated glucose transporter member 5-like isoform X2 [Antedon mediterranea]|uniref:solute carrier family 2, facilitated glucose transporter member 5-like isoform X2 n=1 Tax=Antedon mediterranea TaxID=105859 RepID=UPI003AF56EF2
MQESVEPSNDSLGENKKGDKITLCLFTSALIAAYGSSIQYGYNISVLTGLSTFVQDFYNASYHSKTNEYLSENHIRWLWAITVAVFCIGGSCGALIATYFTNIAGRRGTLLINTAVTSVGALFMFLSLYVNIYEILIVGRFVIGITAGSVTVAVPLYLSEISPVRYRGGISAFHQLGVASGILLGGVSGLYLFRSEEAWPFALLLNMFISWIGAAALYFCPESPRWLLLNQFKSSRHSDELQPLIIDDAIIKEPSRKALSKLRGTVDVDVELNEMLRERAKLEDSSDGGNVSILDLIKLKNPVWKWPLIISIVLISNQQLCGINAIMYYTTELFVQAGLDDNTISIATVGIGTVTTMMSIVTILNVDRLGRRFFLLASYSLMTCATILLTISLTSSGAAWSYLSILFVYLFIFGFSPGPGAMTFVVIPELWTQGPRPAAMAFAGQFNWWSNFTVGLAFPFMLVKYLNLRD